MSAARKNSANSTKPPHLDCPMRDILLQSGGLLAPAGGPWHHAKNFYSSMNWVDKLILEIKRAESPPARLAHDVYRWLERFQVPDVGAMRAIYQALYYAHDAWEGGVQLLGGKLLYEPMVR